MPSNQHEVHLALQAQSNLRDIAAYHKLMVGPTSAKRITDQILNGMEKLGDFPNMGITPPSKIIAEAGFKMLIVGESGYDGCKERNLYANIQSTSFG